MNFTNTRRAWCSPLPPVIHTQEFPKIGSWGHGALLAVWAAWCSKLQRLFYFFFIALCLKKCGALECHAVKLSCTRATSA